MPAVEAWRLRARTAQAMVLLCVAQLVVAGLPFAWWRGSIGRIAPAETTSAKATPAGSAGGPARRLAVHVERGAARLPFVAKCLPRALALCWLLRLRGLTYVFKIAARPAAARSTGPGGDDDLHAWVEAGGGIVLGALPGPWLEVLILRG